MLLFIFATWGVFLALSKGKKTVAYAAMAAAMLSTFTMTGSAQDTKLFYWYTAVVGYTLMFTFSMLALNFSIRSFQETDNKKVNLYLALGAIFAFLGSGGSLVITSPTCSFLLAVLIVCFDKVKEKVKLVIPFAFALIGALVNVAAPGNYQRGDAYINDGHVTVFDGLRDAFSFWISEMKHIFDPLFIVVILAVILIGFICKVKIRENGRYLTVINQGHQFLVRNGGICHDSREVIGGNDEERDKGVNGKAGEHQYPVAVPEAQKLLDFLKIPDITDQHAKGNLPDGMILHQAADGNLLFVFLEGTQEALGVVIKGKRFFLNWQ